MGERIRALWERLKADFHKNPALWIGIGISAAILVIAYLAYRRQTGAVVPANGYGFPDYGGASGGASGGGGGGYAPYQPPSAPGLPIPNPFTPTSPVSNPFPPFSFGPPSGGGSAGSSGAAGETGVYRGSTPYSVQGSVQNPTAAQDAQHQGLAVPSLASVQNPTAPAQQAHRGSQPVLPPIQNPTAASQLAHRGQRRPARPAPRKPPVTTIRPANSGHGRVA